MAKSKSFFGLRSGSTKNFTFSELNGAQITKERVTKIKNPRSSAQMRQRMLMTSVGCAYRYLKSITDHSFEGVTYGQSSMAKFMSLNLSKFRDAAQNDNSGVAFNSYKDNAINPMRFIVSKGSLNPVPYVVNANNQIGMTYSAAEVDTAEKIYKAMGIMLGDMLTFVWINGESSLINGVFSYTPSTLNIVRLTASVSGTVAAPHDAFTVEANHDGLDINVTFADGVLSFATTEANFGCVILSRKSDSTWLRSDAAMVGNKSIIEGVSVANQLSTYPIGETLVLNGGELAAGAAVDSKTALTLTLSASSVSISTAGGTVDAPTLSGNEGGGAVTYTSSNKSIATVDASTGKVTAVGNGTAVITVAVAATDDYAASSITFNVVVSGQSSSGSTDAGGSGTIAGGDDSSGKL